jgi:3',5'-cyclic AMP phosphodiesterase CpdA
MKGKQDLEEVPRSHVLSRRDFLKLAGLGTVVFASGLGRPIIGRAAAPGDNDDDDFFFLQLSDTHWGFNDPAINPDYAGTLKKAIGVVNGLPKKPDFLVFTGDLTHTADDPKERRKRMGEFRDIIKDIKVKDIKFLAGEHDASLDSGEAFHEFFGSSYYTFDHKGVHFIAIDNVSDPRGMVGDTQLAWLETDLEPKGKDTPIVVLTHRPLFGLYPQWDWATRDGAEVINLLMPYSNVTVLYGHIHQEHHHTTGSIAHHAARGLMYPLPAPGSVPKRAPVPWDPSQPYKNLGFRGIDANGERGDYTLTEFPVKGG